MSPEDRSAIMSLVYVPGHGRQGSPEDVLEHFSETDGAHLGLRLLQQAIERRDATDAELALVACSAFGVTSDHLNALVSLSSADWHRSHENVVRLLGQLQTPNAIDALYGATQWIPEYLDWDDNRSLARNAIWAIGKTAGTDADTALQRLLASDDKIIRDGAREQIERRARA